MQRGVGVDEGQVLALQRRVGDGGRGRRCRARHAPNLRGERRRGVDESSSEGPAKGMCLVSVPVTDETEHVAGDVLEALEVAVAKDAALKNAEPDLDLIDPGSVQRRVDEVERYPRLLDRAGRLWNDSGTRRYPT